jgi:SagB-type dehydrogenase family enzyme
MFYRLMLVFWLCICLLLPVGLMAAEESTPVPREITLSSPDTSGGMPLNQALFKRHSVREFTEQEVEWNDLSQILWAADGITRSESGKRTAPSAMAVYPARIYLASKQGVYLFHVQEMKLTLVVEGDHRKSLSRYKSVEMAPVSLIAVADTAKTKATMDVRWKGNPENEKLSVLFCHDEGGAMAQNIYLEATSLGLATVFVGGFNKKEISDLLQLKGEVILWVMPIGYEKATK